MGKRFKLNEFSAEIQYGAGTQLDASTLPEPVEGLQTYTSVLYFVSFRRISGLRRISRSYPPRFFLPPHVNSA